MRKLLSFILILVVPSLCFASVWKIVPDKSSITFTATQNNAPVSGSFKSFEGVIGFNPKELDGSQVSVAVNINSVTTTYAELTTTLLGPDWFNVKQYPQAQFKADKITKVKDNQYEVQGDLTIRDKTVKITVPFEVKQYSDSSAVFVGHVSLKRLLFGVGQGDWAKTDQVKDEVDVNFTITTQK